MLNNLIKIKAEETIDTSSSEEELQQLREENHRYKEAFSQIETVAERVSIGDLSARIISWDEFGELSATLARLNNNLDLIDAFVRESGATLQHASQGKFYRTFIERGLLGDFKRGANIINSAQKYMADRELNKKTEMIELADNLEREVKSAVDIVQFSGEAMRSKSEDMSNNLEIVTGQANEVVNLSNDATSNVESCAAAVEEMSASAQEIFRQVSSSSESMLRAEEEIAKTSKIVAGLASAAEEIGDIANMIKDIASRTNLLALNATIEAARAGEFGKGFAVVASEVKNLATQTGEATDRVDTQINTIQQMAIETTRAVENIGTVIQESGEISKSVASAAEEQLNATKEISENVQQAAQSTQKASDNVTDVATNTTKSSSTANEVASEAVEVSQATELLSGKVVEIMSNLRSYDAFNRRMSERKIEEPETPCEVSYKGEKLAGKINNISRTGASIEVQSAAISGEEVIFTPTGSQSAIVSTVIENKDGTLRITFNHRQSDIVADL